MRAISPTVRSAVLYLSRRYSNAQIIEITGISRSSIERITEDARKDVNTFLASLNDHGRGVDSRCSPKGTRDPPPILRTRGFRHGPRERGPCGNS